jgi:hypothetical protein
MTDQDTAIVYLHHQPDCFNKKHVARIVTAVDNVVPPTLGSFHRLETSRVLLCCRRSLRGSLSEFRKSQKIPESLLVLFL